MTAPTDLSQYFRAGVGIAVVDESDRLLVLERDDVPGAWQLPQGGLEAGETPVEAARRELWEETRISWQQVKLLGEHPHWLAYELPRESWTTKTGRGQVQRWFVVRLVDSVPSIDIDAPDPETDRPESRAFTWMSLKELLDQATAFREPLYEQLVEYIRSLRSTNPRRSG